MSDTNNQAASAAPGGQSGAPPVTDTVHYLSVAASGFAPDGLHTTSEDYWELNRQDLANHTDSSPAAFDSVTVTTPSYVDTTKAITSNLRIVNYATYAYAVGVCPTGDTTFSGVRLVYTTP